MKKSFFVIIAVLTLGVFLGFSNSDNLPGTKSKTNSNTVITAPVITPNDNNNPVATNGYVPYFIDNFNAPNDTTALKARGYVVYRNGTFSGTPGATWFTGNPLAFPALNGDPDDYVGSNFQSGGTSGNIDNWLVLPDLDVVAGDTICFFSRSPVPGTTYFPDSIRVMYNPTNNTLPSNPNWVELGRFQVIATGAWQLRAFRAPTTGSSARFAIRYSVVDGGTIGANSDYIGIDSLVVRGNGVLPVELAGFASVISNNDVTLNWSTATETNNSGFDIERSLLNGQWSKVGNVVGNGTSTSSTNYSFTDRNLNSGNYNYRLKQIDFNGNFEYFNLSNEVIVGIPSKFELSQNYPNPFNPSTKIEYQLPNDGNVNITVYDNSGKEVMSLVSEFKSAGYYTINFNASSLSTGVYFYQIISGDFSAVKKMMLVK